MSPPSDDKNNSLDSPINHLEAKKEFLEAIHDALVLSKKIETTKKTDLIDKTKHELEQFDNAIDILKDHESDGDAT